MAVISHRMTRKEQMKSQWAWINTGDNKPANSELTQPASLQGQHVLNFPFPTKVYHKML